MRPRSLRAATFSTFKRTLTAMALIGWITPLTAPAADDASDRLARLEAAVEALQQQNTALQRELAELKKSKKSPIADATPKPATADASVKTAVASDGKAVVESTESAKKRPAVSVSAGGTEAKLVLGGFIQGHYEVGDVSAYDGRFPGSLTPKTKDRFRLRRARINVTGDFAEQFDFKLEGDFGSSDTGLNVHDANGQTLASNTNRVSFGGTDVWVNWHRLPELNVKFGQFKAPFGLEQLTPDTKLPFTERSQVSEALTPERQIGLQIWGKPFASVWPDQKELLTYSAGVFNGSGRNTTTNDNNEYMYVARLESQFFSGKLAGQDVSLKVGGNYFTSRDEKGLNISQSGNLLVGTDGSLSSFVLPSAGEREGYGVDGSIHFGLFDLTAEYLSERVRPRTAAGLSPAFERFRADGYYVAGTYFVVPKKLQLGVKWESFDPGQLDNDDVDSLTAGVNYYIHGDDLKLMADYIHTWSDFRHENAGFGDDEFNEVILRLQVMF